MMHKNTSRCGAPECHSLLLSDQKIVSLIHIDAQALPGRESKKSTIGLTHSRDGGGGVALTLLLFA